MDYSAPNNAYGYDDLDDFAVWWMNTTGVVTNEIGSDGDLSAFNPDEFDQYVDGAAADAPADLEAPPDLPSEDMNWMDMLNFPPSIQGASSVYSDGAASGTLPGSVSSITSGETAVGTPNASTIDFDNEKSSFAALGGTDLSSFLCPVTDLLTSDLSTPPIEYNPAAYSLHQGDTAYWQLMPQHHMGAAAASAFGPMSMQAGDLVAPLISQDPVPAPGTATEAVPEGAPLVAENLKRATDNMTAAEAPKAKRRRQTTEKIIDCPYCDKKWSRQNNLDVHIRSVHNGQRPFACEAEGCARSFSRRHDMRRHYQSNHTTLGSPRRKVPKSE